MQDKIKNAQILLESLPYIREFYNKTFVIKYGGSAQIDPALREKVAQDIVLLKLVGINVIVVHGGGKHINEVISQFGLQPEFRNGLRVTDSETMSVAEMVLSGRSNKDLVTLINKHGGKAIGLSGKDGPCLRAVPFLDEDGHDYGHVGVVEEVSTDVLELLEKGGYIPVISPVAIGEDGKTFNVNADTAAGKIAESVKAAKLIYLTDVQGIYRDFTNKKDLLSSISKQQALQLIDEGVISAGMIPKVHSIIDSLEGGVNKVHIINGMVEHALLLEIFTDGGIGTEFHL